MIKLAIIHLKGHIKQSVITVCGILVSVAALIVAMGITNGLGNNTIRSMLHVSPHIKVESKYGPIVNYKEKIDRISNIEGVEGVYPKVLGKGIVKFNSFLGIHSEGVVIEGTSKEGFDRLSKDIVMGSIKEGKAIIGEELAESINVEIGDKITLISHENLSTEIEVSAIYKTGFYDYDSNFVVIPLDRAQDMLDEPNISMFDVRVKDVYQANTIAKNIEQKLFLFSQSWMQMNEQLLKSLIIERNIVLILFSLLYLITGFILYVLISNMIRNKVMEIGILRAIGFSKKNILNSFILMGLILAAIGISLGLSLAYILKVIITRYNFVYFQEVYYIPDNIPFLITIKELSLVILGTMLLSIISIIGPAFRASNLDPVKSLKRE